MAIKLKLDMTMKSCGKKIHLKRKKNRLSLTKKYKKYLKSFVFMMTVINLRFRINLNMSTASRLTK